VLTETVGKAQDATIDQRESASTNDRAGERCAPRRFPNEPCFSGMGIGSRRRFRLAIACVWWNISHFQRFWWRLRIWRTKARSEPNEATRTAKC